MNQPYIVTKLVYHYTASIRWLLRLNLKVMYTNNNESAFQDLFKRDSTV